jgi:hypothetical protein
MWLLDSYDSDFRYVQSVGFDGCIKDVQFDTEKWDLNKNTRALGVVPACPDKVIRYTVVFQRLFSLKLYKAMEIDSNANFF